LKETLFEIGERLLRSADRKNISQTEVYLESLQRRKLTVEGGSVKTAKRINDQGVGIRTAIGSQLGFAYTTSLAFSDCQDVLEQSATLARVNDEDPLFVEFPTSVTSYPRVSGIYDKRLTNLKSEEISTLLFRAVESNQNHLRAGEVIIYGDLVVTTKSIAVLNSNAVQTFNERTQIMLEIDSTLRTDDQQLTSYESQCGTRLADVDPEWVGQTAAENTLRMIHPKPVENKRMPLVLSPRTLESLFGMGFTSAVNAENYLTGQSYLNGLLESDVASEDLVIVDDGSLEGGYNSSPFDGEGSPSSQTEILEGGILKSLLHSSYTANASGSTNTGNAVRDSYSALPSVGRTNLQIKPGKGTLEDLLSEMSEGIYCQLSLDQPNSLTGEINALIMEGFYIKDGKIQHPVRNTTFGINMCDLLNRIVRIGDDTRMMEGFLSPSVLIESVVVTSD